MIFNIYAILVGIFLCVFHIKKPADALIINLGDPANWRFYCVSNALCRKPMRPIAIPGDVYSDMTPYLKESPLFGENDINFRWIANETWIYERNFSLSSDMIKNNVILLHINGLDTYGRVYLNNNLLISSSNQFISHVVDIGNYLTETTNFIVIEFSSPIKMAYDLSMAYYMTYSHGIPPECTNNIQNGECHVNFLRKIQASFSWDWGPGIPTVGIWQPIYIELFSNITILEFSPLVNFTNENFIIDAFIKFSCTSKRKLYVKNVHLLISISELNVSKKIMLKELKSPENTFSHYDINLELPLSQNLTIERWYPRGYGTQRLYNCTAFLLSSDKVISSVTKFIGFRKVELVQELVDAKSPFKGRTFYFKINDVPIFLKGSNWVPISAFPAQNHTLRLNFLFNSMVEANFNVIRVWGGGRYESEEFYQLANKKGILIWQDLMFACALYPINNAFLANVEKEILQQTYRLRSHPSILVYSGNNENELAITTNWFFEMAYNRSQIIHDYYLLYRNLIFPLIRQIDRSRPFLFSSPSNGIISEKNAEKGVLPGESNSVRYGDVHFYNELINLWRDEDLLIPRCATEFGVQSLPSIKTLQKWISSKELWYGSKSMMSRQHHPGSAALLIHMISQHFQINKENFAHPHPFDNQLIFEKIIFLTQLHQAIALKTQVEHYRRWKNKLDQNGFGLTMCAMYWQLNDIWAAPSWSSIDFELRWKPAHYFARRFLAPVIISIFVENSTNLNVYIVSDLQKPLYRIYLMLSVFLVNNHGLAPIYTNEQFINLIPANSVISVNFTVNIAKLKRLNTEPDDFIFRVTADLKDTEMQIFPAVLLPNVIKKCESQIEQICSCNNLQIIAVKRITDFEYQLELAAETIIPIVWIEFNNIECRLSSKDCENVPHFFSDNAFMMAENKHYVVFRFFPNEAPFSALTINDFTVTTLNSYLF